MKKLCMSTFVILVILFSNPQAGPFQLFGSIQTVHTTIFPTGGIRYNLNNDICFDATIGATAGYNDDASNGITGYVDIFIYKQTIGLGLTLSKWDNADLLATLGLLYALEKPINDNIVLGVSPTLVAKTFASGYGVDFLPGFAVYTLIAW
ncbi:MAG TPA: hypothetical protein VHO70_19925 [Chitinispirillaceae bacterium]|nr:hypothetical protein [Chitinispirillaceae bacterium]